MPAYNEEKRIGPTLERYSAFFDEHYPDYEIFVILNGCKDNTLEIVKDYANKFDNIRFKNYKEAIGKGGAIIEGFKLVEGDFIGFVDADCATPPKAFFELVKNIGGNQGIIASRWLDGSKIGQKQPFLRRFFSRGFNLFVKLNFFFHYTDTQCGAKLFTKRAVKKIYPYLGLTRWAFDIDILYHMKRNKFRVIEYPTEWNDQEGSKLNAKKAIPNMFLSVVRLRLLYSPFKFIVIMHDFVKFNVFGK